MTKKDDPSRISHNPSAKRIQEAVAFARIARAITGLFKKLSITDENIENIHRAADAALSAADIVDLPDRFNDAFSNDGWIATNSMCADTMRQALHLYESGKKQEAEDIILSWFDRDHLALFAINRAKKFNKASNRWNQLQEALNLTFEERYWSAVPLILIACDGFASDVLGSSPFEKDANLTVFDSIVGHPHSLQRLIGKITKGVRKTSDKKLSLPLRHGILHGQSLGYANRTVCMKAWLLMVALVDWAHDKESEGERRLESQTTLELNFHKNVSKPRDVRAERRIIDAYELRNNFKPFEAIIDKNSPKYAILEFLNSWKTENFGIMAERSVNLSRQSVKKMAGQLRRDAELVKLLEFELRAIRQTTVARADAVAYLWGRTAMHDVKGEYEIIAFRYSESGDIATPSDPGTWRVQEACMYKLLHGQTMDRDST